MLIDTLKRDGWFVQVDDMPGAMPFERDEWRNYTDKIYTIRKERQYFSVNVVNNNAHVMMYVHYNDDVKAFVEEVFVAKFKGLA